MNPLILSSHGNQYTVYPSQVWAKNKLDALKTELGNLPTGVRKHFDGKNIVFIETIYGVDRIHVITKDDALFDEKKKFALLVPTSCEHLHTCSPPLTDAVLEFIYPDSTQHIHAVESPSLNGCCDDPEVDELTFDDEATSDTITEGNVIGLFTYMGCPPLKWETENKGYTFPWGTESLGSSNLLGCTIGEPIIDYDCPTVLVKVTDTCGTMREIEITNSSCCDCDDSANDLEFDDDNTPNTIVAGDSIGVYILKGCGDFIYEVSGTGYTWHSTGTTTVTSSNRNEQLDCADGT